jgi:hypothetical protein
MSLQKGALRALAQWFHPDRHHGRLDRLAVTAACGHCTAQRLQCVQHPLAHTLALKDRPIVVTARQ